MQLIKPEQAMANVERAIGPTRPDHGDSRRNRSARLQQIRTEFEYTIILSLLAEDRFSSIEMRFCAARS
jgi:hypothetical protein